MIGKILRKIKKYNDDWAICIDYSDKEKTTISMIEINRKKFDIYEGKEVAKEILKCECVDGKNLYDGDKYLGGVYIDDMEFYAKRYKAVIINEVKRVTLQDTLEINKYLKDNNVVDNLLRKVYDAKPEISIYGIK